MRQASRAKWPGNVDKMFAYRVAQKGVDKSHVAVGGASCGVAQSTDLAARNHDIKTVLALSGPATDETRSYAAQTPDLAIFGAARESDTNAAKGIEALLGASKRVQNLPGHRARSPDVCQKSRAGADGCFLDEGAAHGEKRHKVTATFDR